MDIKKINSIIDDIPCISDVQKKFYKAIINERYTKVLLPTFQALSQIHDMDLIK